MTEREREIETLVIDAYIGGANDSTDIYVYVTTYMTASFAEVEAIIQPLFGPFNFSLTSPANYLLN